MKRGTVSKTASREMDEVNVMVIPVPGISRRTLLAGGTAVGAGLLLGQIAGAESSGGVDGPRLKEYDIASNGAIRE